MTQSIKCSTMLINENSLSCEDSEVKFIDTNPPGSVPRGKEDGPMKRWVEGLHRAFSRNEMTEIGVGNIYIPICSGGHWRVVIIEKISQVIGRKHVV